MDRLVIIERRLDIAMTKLGHHHPQIAGRLRTIWKREDEAWDRGEVLMLPVSEYGVDTEPPNWRERFRSFWTPRF